MNTLYYEPSYEMDFEKEDMEKFAMMCFEDMTHTERFIVESRLGMVDTIPTYEKLGKMLGMSSTNVRKIELKSYEKIAYRIFRNWDDFGRFAHEAFDVDVAYMKKNKFLDRKFYHNEKDLKRTMIFLSKYFS